MRFASMLPSLNIRYLGWHSLFLDEMFTQMFSYREISHMVRRPTRSENALHLLMWVYRERCMHVLYAFWAYYTQRLCWFCTAKAPLRPPLHFHQSKCRACIRVKRLRMSDEDLTAFCVLRRKTQYRSPIYNWGIPQEARVKKGHGQFHQQKEISSQRLTATLNFIIHKIVLIINSLIEVSKNNLSCNIYDGLKDSLSNKSCGNCNSIK